MPNAIVHFEIPADDVQRAKKFYEDAFGWKISDPWNMNYFLVETRAEGEVGINGGLMSRQNPGQPFMNYINVDSIEEACKKVEDAGGAIILPKREIGQGMGWIAAFKDTEGNILGFTRLRKNQPDIPPSLPTARFSDVALQDAKLRDHPPTAIACP